MTWDPANVDPTFTLSNGNLTVRQTASDNVWHNGKSKTLRTSATIKAYAEFQANLFPPEGGEGPGGIGMSNSAQAVGSGHFMGDSSSSLGYYFESGNVYAGGALVTNLMTAAQGNRIDMATDFVHNLVWFRVNGGNWNNSGTANPATAVGGIDISAVAAAAMGPAITLYGNVDAAPSQITANFGQNVFLGALPAGYTSWP
jgi:hypothetical protein